MVLPEGADWTCWRRRRQHVRSAPSGKTIKLISKLSHSSLPVVRRPPTGRLESNPTGPARASMSGPGILDWIQGGVHRSPLWPHARRPVRHFRHVKMFSTFGAIESNCPSNASRLVLKRARVHKRGAHSGLPPPESSQAYVGLMSHYPNPMKCGCRRYFRKSDTFANLRKYLATFANFKNFSHLPK